MVSDITPDMLTSTFRTAVLAGTLLITTQIPVLFPPDASGLWEINVHNEAASERVVVNIQQDGDQLKGTYVGSYQEANLDGQLEGKHITFTYDLDGFRVTYVGRLSGRSISGTYHAGEFENGVFNGRRKNG